MIPMRFGWGKTRADVSLACLDRKWGLDRTERASGEFVDLLFDVTRRRSRFDLDRDSQQSLMTVILDEYLWNHKFGAREIPPTRRSIAVLGKGETPEAGESAAVVPNKP